MINYKEEIIQNFPSHFGCKAEKVSSYYYYDTEYSCNLTIIVDGQKMEFQYDKLPDGIIRSVMEPEQMKNIYEWLEKNFNEQKSYFQEVGTSINPDQYKKYILKSKQAPSECFRVTDVFGKPCRQKMGKDHILEGEIFYDD